MNSDLEVGCKGRYLIKPADYILFDYQAAKDQNPKRLLFLERRLIMFNIPTVNIKLTGENIIRLRKSAGLSVRDIQCACGFSTPQAIYKWQQGLALPTIDNLVVLSALLGVTIDEIIVVEDYEQAVKAS